MRLNALWFPNLLYGTTTEEDLRQQASDTVWKIYRHVSRKRLYQEAPEYLPKIRRKENSKEAFEETKFYNTMLYVRGRADDDNLNSADYDLLTYVSEILGCKYFGGVDACDGGWRWSFVQFGHKEKAIEDLRWIRLALYPIWILKEEGAAHQTFLSTARLNEQSNNCRRSRSVAMWIIFGRWSWSTAAVPWTALKI